MNVRRTVVFRIERSQRLDGWGEYTVPVEDHTTVVDALEWIEANTDRTLLFRHSCHHGSCGTCGMLVNGDRILACTANVLEVVAEAAGNDGAADGARGRGSAERDRDDPAVVELRPLETMTHIGDLAVDPTPLFRDFPVAAEYLRPSEANKASETPDEIDRYMRFENCIECGLCVSACPVIPLRGFMGPAALAAYNRELDKHAERSAELLPQVDIDRGAWGCDRHLACSAVCPTGVYPAKQIVMLQKKIKKFRDE